MSEDNLSYFYSFVVHSNAAEIQLKCIEASSSYSYVADCYRLFAIIKSNKNRLRYFKLIVLCFETNGTKCFELEEMKACTCPSGKLLCL